MRREKIMVSRVAQGRSGGEKGPWGVPSPEPGHAISAPSENRDQTERPNSRDISNVKISSRRESNENANLWTQEYNSEDFLFYLLSDCWLFDWYSKFNGNSLIENKINLIYLK